MPDDREDSTDAGEPGSYSLTTRGELIAAAALAIGAFVLIGGVLLLVGPTGTDDPGPSPTVSPGSDSGSPTPAQASFPISPQNEDEQAIHDLARLSIVSIPEGRWADLYDDFTQEFRSRCSAEEFAQAGRDAAINLGHNLSLLGFKGLREMSITGDTARVVIVGELQGQSEYEVEAFFRLEDGVWKIAPSPESAGCSSFNPLSA